MIPFEQAIDPGIRDILAAWENNEHNTKTDCVDNVEVFLI